MGVLNVTPDSFSDGGRFVHVEAAVECALTMIQQGATIIDIGGESTRPGAEPVSVEEEVARVVPVIKLLKEKSNIVISIDTSKADVMQEAVSAGAGLINDVYALRLPNALEIAAKLDVPVCLMHMQGSPKGMQDRPSYEHVLDDIIAFFKERLLACEQAGISRDKVILDPGFGFGKTQEHNITILANLSVFRRFKCPLLVGLSRKSMLGAIVGKEVDERLAASLAAALIAVEKGASIVRVHDVAETADMLAVHQAVQQVL